MFRSMLKSKIHRARVTEANLDYVGSVTIDADIMDAVDLLPNEKVLIADVTNGARIETYAIAGERGSGIIGINGAAAHLVHPNDLVIIFSFAILSESECQTHHPKIAIMGRSNEIVELLHEELAGSIITV